MDDYGLHILHLEDDAFDADLAHRAVAGWGLPVRWHTVASREAFDEAMAHQPFDAILSDHSLPGLDGLQALHIAREGRPDAPFLFLSGSSNEQRVQQCLEAGAGDFVTKNELWRLQLALRHLRDHVERRRLERENRGMSVLVEVVQKLSLARRLEDVMAIVREGARALTGADGVTFVLRDRDHCFYADEDAIGPLWKGQRFPLEGCINGWAMLNRQSVVIPDIYADPRIPLDAYRSTFVKSLVIAPIRTQSPIGSIGYYWARPHRATPREVALIQALADTTSVAMENVQLFTDLDHRVRVRTAELEQANEELEAFSYSVSHDLRAPLRAVDGYVRLLQERSAQRLDDEGRRFLSTVQGSAQRMGIIIEDLLKLSKIGRSELHSRMVNLSVIARDVFNALRTALPNRDVSIDMASELWVYGDPGLLRTVMENLLSNAWKYSAKRARARIELQPWLTPEGEKGFCVRDNGAGFDMAHAGRLFEPFRRMHQESEFSGIGIGLAIVRRVVQRHGGRVWAEARKDEGASFFVVLPQAPAAGS